MSARTTTQILSLKTRTNNNVTGLRNVWTK